MYGIVVIIVSTTRNRLNPQTAGKLFFVAKNWKWFQGIVNMNALVANRAEEEEDIVE